MKEYIEYQQCGAVGILQINRPEVKNALSRAVVDELDMLLDQIAADSEVRALVLGGSSCFAAGADIKEMIDCTPEEAMAFAFSPTFNKLAALDIPTIAAMDGFALGGGLELALACDFRLATEQVRLSFPEINLGIMPGAGGTIRLPRLVGEAKAKELILFGKQIDGVEALRIGLVNSLVSPEALLDTAVSWGEKLAGKFQTALTAAKKTIQAGMTLPCVEDGILLEGAAWAQLFSTADQKEGMRAFLEKRSR